MRTVAARKPSRCFSEYAGLTGSQLPIPLGPVRTAYQRKGHAEQEGTDFTLRPFAGLCSCDSTISEKLCVDLYHDQTAN
jgi:hypothetical protein